MQRVTLVRYSLKPEHAAENEALTRDVFEHLRRERPQLSYGVFRDGLDWTHLFVNLNGEGAEELTESNAFKAYSRDIGARCAAPPQIERFALEGVDAFGFRP
jgi:quinol monooxygenase YgiN